MDGGLPGWGLAPYHWTGGGSEEWCLPRKTCQLFRSKDGVWETNLRQRSVTLQGKSTASVYFIKLHSRKQEVLPCVFETVLNTNDKRRLTGPCFTLNDKMLSFSLTSGIFFIFLKQNLGHGRSGINSVCVSRQCFCSSSCGCGDNSLYSSLFVDSNYFFVLLFTKRWSNYFLLSLSSEQWATLQAHWQHSPVAQSHGVSGTPQGEGNAQTHACSLVNRHVQTWAILMS